MKSKTYYNTKYESEANINDLSNSILLNCVGVVNETKKNESSCNKARLLFDVYA